MSTSLKEMLSHSIAPLLKSKGFKGTGLIFNRIRGDFVDVIEFERDTKTILLGTSFTFSVGIFSHNLFDIIAVRSVGKKIREVDCVVRSRIGELMDGKFKGKALDKWWKLASDDSILDQEKEILHLVENSVMPFIESFNTLEDIRAFLLNCDTGLSKFPIHKLNLAVVEYLLGEKIKAKELLSNNCWEERAKNILAKLEHNNETT